MKVQSLNKEAEKENSSEENFVEFAITHWLTKLKALTRLPKFSTILGHKHVKVKASNRGTHMDRELMLCLH